MQNSKERLITFFDLKVTAYAQADRTKYNVPPFPLDTLIAKIQDLKAAGICPSARRKSETVYLADIDVDAARSRVVLLINLSDKAASDTVYTNPEANQRRVVPKVGDEGSDFSAHVVIKLNQVDGVYVTILELVHGLASSKIMRFLTFLFKQCSKVDPVAFTQPHPNGGVDLRNRPITVVTRHVASLAGHPSDQFMRDLDTGTISSIELIDKRNENLPWDNVGRMREMSRSVLLRPGQVAGTNFDRIQDAARRAFRDHYGVARIQFKTATKIGRSVMLETQHLHLAQDSIFVKKEKIDGFANPLEASYDTIHPEIKAKILPYL